MVTRGVLSLWWLALALGGRAYADPARLTAVRKAVEDVRYDDARGLLVEALRAGHNSPEELVEIYQLSAATATVLGQSELAEQYYRRVLALDPDARLPADASPKLRQPFVAAQAYMAAHGRLDVRVARRGRRIEVTVAADPLGMVAAVTWSAGGEALPAVAVTGAPIVLTPRGAAGRIVVLDEHGNLLRTLAAPGQAAEPARSLEEPPPPTPPTPPTPIVRRWVTWTIPAVVFAGAGGVFLINAQRAKGRLDDILASNGMHFLDDAEQERRTWRDDTLIANVAFATAGAFAVTAIIMAATRPSSGPRPAVTATMGAGHVGLSLTAKF
jgi:hypothetical protein